MLRKYKIRLEAENKFGGYFMKKAFPLRKRLSAALAIVLSVACFAGAVPANATGEYSYSPVGNYGTFEDYMWGIVDDSDKAYELSFAAADGEVGAPVATKTGSDSASPWAKLYTRKISLTAGAEYQVSFKIKSADVNTNSRFKLFGVKYAADGTLPSDHNITFSNVKIDGNSAEEAALSENWTDYTAEFTVDSAAPLNEFRIWIPGNKGTQITVKSFDVKQITEQTVYNTTAYLDDKWKSSKYNNPDLDTAKLEVVQNGYTDGNIGAVHFYKQNAATDTGTEVRISYSIKNANFEIGKTYVFEAYVNGKITAALPMYVEMQYGLCKWEDNTGAWALNESYSDWTLITREFSRVLAGDFELVIKTGGYSTADYYIDNIVIYDKDDATKTNLIQGGDFCKTAPATTLDGWKRNEGANPLWANVYYNPGYDDFKVEVADEGCNSGGAVHFLKKKAYFFDDNTGAKSARIVNFVDAETMSKFDVGTKFVFKADFNGSVADEDPLKVTFEGSSGTYTWDDTAGLNYHDLKINTSGWESKEFEFTMTEKGHMFFVIRTGGYSIADLYIDNVQIYAINDPGTNLISNSTFCETESVVSDSSAIDNSEFKVTNIPGYDIGMLVKDGTNAYAVPGGSRDGSTALKITSTGVEAYFQTKGDETFDDDLSKGKIALVKGDIAVKASGYFKELDGSSSKAEPKVWFGLGKNLKIGTKTGSSVGSHYKSPSDRYDTEVFETLADGWVRFEMTLNDTLLKKANSSLSDVGRVRVMCGVDADDSKTTYGAALFDDIKVEIISQYAAGDTNGDDSIDIRDLVHMKRYAAGAVKFTEMTRGTWLSDIGYDESPSVTNELVAMRKFLVGAASEYCK